MSEPARDDAPAGRLNLKSNRNDVPNGTFFFRIELFIGRLIQKPNHIILL